MLDGKLIDFDGHVKRLARSLGELDLTCPIGEAGLLAMHRELVARNGIDQGMIYLQITRGNPGDRSFLFPDASVPATIVAFTQDIPNMVDAPAAKTGIKIITIPDLRWSPVDIKTCSFCTPRWAGWRPRRPGS